MRNVITLSNMPKEIHVWLKQEAVRQGRLTGKRVGIYQVVVQAVQDYKENVENQKNTAIEIFRKKLQPAEVKRHCVCVPREKWQSFGDSGTTIIIDDAKDSYTYRVLIGTQCRLSMRDWYNRHPSVKAGDEIIFKKTNGVISVHGNRCLTIQDDI